MLGQQATAGHDHRSGKLIDLSPGDKIIQALADTACGSRGQNLVEAWQLTQLAPRAVDGNAGVNGAVKSPAKSRLLADNLGHYTGIDLGVTVEKAQHDAIGPDRQIAAEQTLEPRNFAAVGRVTLTQPEYDPDRKTRRTAHLADQSRLRGQAISQARYEL